MAQQQQTVLRVRTNIESGVLTVTGTTALSMSSTGITQSGSGTESAPYSGATTGTSFNVVLTNSGGSGLLNYDIDLTAYTGVTAYSDAKVQFSIEHASGYNSGNSGFVEYGTSQIAGSIEMNDGDVLTITGGSNITTGATMTFYIVPNVDVNNPTVYTYDNLDLYTDIPLKLNKSIAEIQDISKRNSDYSVGFALPGSKKNNSYFESYFNVDTNSLFFDVTKRVPVDVLINDESYFTGYMRLNKVSVIDNKIEYDVTLYSTVGDLFGQIGNNLLRDLNYNDIDYHFNHNFNIYNVTSEWSYNPLVNGKSVPSLWFYPIVHNGYEYSGDTVNFTGGTNNQKTRLYTTTKVGTYATYAAFEADNGLDYRINSPKNPILDNQLKPALNVWGLIQLMFKNYGYTIKSDFFNTPWFKLLYTYGFYSSDATKFGYKTQPPQRLSLEGVDILLVPTTTGTTEYNCVGSGGPYDKITTNLSFYVVKKGTGVPALCTEQINISFNLELLDCTGNYQYSTENIAISPLVSGYTYPFVSTQYVDCGSGCPYVVEYKTYTGFNAGSSNVELSNKPLAYFPTGTNQVVSYEENNPVDFSLVIDENLKQIDFLSSIAKKFNLVFIPDPDVPNQMIIEPYDYYVGTGIVYDWTDKLSRDKGFTVQPAQNFVESELDFSDLEDGDDGNKIFKDKNNRIYGENFVYNPTDFKSQKKDIRTIYSPEIIRKWDDNVGIPLGINYAGSSQSQDNGNSQSVNWFYKGIKSKPKLMFNLGNFSPFLDKLGESYNFGSSFRTNTMYFRIQRSDATNPGDPGPEGFVPAIGSLTNPVISHTMPMGNPDENKINNDSICNLFNSEEPQDIGIGIPTFNAYTENDVYNLFYSNRIDNLYNKNTRFLEANFYLKLSDIKNYRYNDIIKIQEQYFILNKLNGYNLTNPELTKVELIQTNITTPTYPTRYFNYQYCGDATVYKFNTYFNPEDNVGGHIYTTSGETATSLRRTYMYWSILYDYFVGTLNGNVSGYTSSYSNSTNQRWAYSIWEVDKDTFDGVTDWHYDDDNNLLFIDQITSGPTEVDQYENPNIWCFSNTGTTKAFFNVATNCTQFSGYCSSNGVILQPAPGSTPVSIYHSGVTLNITDTGWIKYNSSVYPTGTYQYMGSLGDIDLGGCVDCSSIKVGIPFSDVAGFTIVDCGSSC